MRFEFEDVVSKVAELSGESVEDLLEGYENGSVQMFSTWKEAFEWLNTDVNDNYDNLEYLLEELIMTTSDDLKGYENLLHKFLANDDRIVFLDDEITVLVNK